MSTSTLNDFAGPIAFGAAAALGSLAARRRDQSKAGYPEPDRGNTSDDFFGTTVADPYRWMEDVDSEATKAWLGAQESLFARFKSSLKHREAFKRELAASMEFDKVSAPFRRGRHFFQFSKPGLQNQSVLEVAESVEGPWHVFLDPNTLSKDGTTALHGTWFSLDGRYMAYGLAERGADWVKLRIRDVDTGKDLTLAGSDVVDEVQNVKFSGVSWLHDGSGFLYSCYEEKAESELHTGQHVGHTVKLHAVGQPWQGDQVVMQAPSEGPGATWIYGGRVTEDGNYIIVSVYEGCDPNNRVFVAPLDDCTLGREAARGMSPHEAFPFAALVDNFDAAWDYVVNVGRSFYWKTTLGAGRWRIVRTDLPDGDSCEDLDLGALAVDVVPEREHAVASADLVSRVDSPHGYGILVRSTKDVGAVMELFDLTGALLCEVPLPTFCAIQGCDATSANCDVYFKTVSMTSPGTVHQFDANSLASTVLRTTTVPGIDTSLLAVRQEFVRSKDGTRIPVAVLAHRDALDADGRPTGAPRPCVLYGYGGFGVTISPSFSISRALFALRYGGVFAVANIRGGEEYGEEWHNGGKLANKQNVFDDFIASAEWLCDARITSRERLVCMGGSNGGLLVAAVANQRPNLFAGVICQVPVTDMLRFHRFSIGSAWCTDYGNAERSKEEFETLYAYSPLHNVRVQEHQFPAIMVLTADHDDRVVPSHSFKYVATLQHVLGCDPKQSNPLLLRVDRDAGHGAGTPTSKIIDSTADIYAAVLHWTGQ